jgi:hypothetical protein
MQILINYDRNILDKLYIADVSPYPIDGVGISDVEQVRFKFATYDSVANSSTATVAIAWFEYEVIEGSVIVNGRTYNVGATFILANDFNIPSTAKIQTTGYYSPYSQYLPTDTSDAEFTPSQVGDATDIIFADAVRYVVYEIYDNETSAGSVTVATPTQFIVKGTDSDFIEIGAETYYVGEVFTKSSNFTFTGTSTICSFVDSVESYTWTDKYAYGIYEEYISKLANDNNQKTNFVGDFLKVYGNLNSLYLGAETNANVDLRQMQNSLNLINDYFSQRI